MSVHLYIVIGFNVRASCANRTLSMLSQLYNDNVESVTFGTRACFECKAKMVMTCRPSSSRIPYRSYPGRRPLLYMVQRPCSLRRALAKHSKGEVGLAFDTESMYPTYTYSQLVVILTVM